MSDIRQKTLLDNLIKIGQSASMSGLYQFLSGAKNPPETLQSDLQEVFRDFLAVIGSPCGIIVLYSPEEESFVEVSTFGYADSDFYYEFMRRGLGSFERVSNSPEPIIFPSGKFTLFRSKDYAIAMRIYPENMMGFILAEVSSPGDLEWRKWILGLLAFRISQVLSSKKEREPIKFLEGNRSSEDSTVEIILSQIPSWENKFREGINKRVFSLRRKPGSGEKPIIRTLFQRMDVRGDLVYLNTIPEQIVKLERYLSEWIEIAGSGFLVFEKTETFSIAQQKLFTKIIPETVGPSFLFLTDVMSSPNEEYPLFWRLVRQTEIYIPELPSLEAGIRRKILDSLVGEIFHLQSKKGMKVEEGVFEFLLEKSESHPLEEIRSVLEMAILQSRGDTLKAEEIRNLWTGKMKNLILIDDEDLDLRRSVEILEKHKVLHAMKLFSGNQMRMSKALGISRGSLQYKMKQMGLL
jgi:hypothetical protein